MATKKRPSEASLKVLQALQEAGPGVKFTTKQLQNQLGFEKAGSVTGSVTGLVKKGFCVRFSEPDEDGKEIKYFALTDEGMNYNPLEPDSED